jgi:hypothetical protein
VCDQQDVFVRVVVARRFLPAGPRQGPAELGSRNLGPGTLPPPLEQARVDLWGQTREEWRRQPFNAPAHR